MHPRDGVFRRNLSGEELLCRSLESLEPRANLTALDIRNLLTKRLNETFFESKFLRSLRSELAFLDLGIAGQKLTLVGGTILSGLKQ